MLEETPRKQKKSVQYTEEYRGEIIRTARVKGKEYVNWKGNLVAAIVPKQKFR